MNVIQQYKNFFAQYCSTNNIAFQYASQEQALDTLQAKFRNGADGAPIARFLRLVSPSWTLADSADDRAHLECVGVFVLGELASLREEEIDVAMLEVACDTRAFDIAKKIIQASWENVAPFAWHGLTPNDLQLKAKSANRIDSYFLRMYSFNFQSSVNTNIC